jgi:hypothetical protein
MIENSWVHCSALKQSVWRDVFFHRPPNELQDAQQFWRTYADAELAHSPTAAHTVHGRLGESVQPAMLAWNEGTDAAKTDEDVTGGTTAGGVMIADGAGTGSATTAGTAATFALQHRSGVYVVSQQAAPLTALPELQQPSHT